jgi:hypothetical protein
MKSDKQLLMFLIAIYLFAVAVVVVGAGAQAISTFVRTGVNQEWLGFTGSVIGGLITAVAGAAAWFAAQRTINVTRAVAERRENDAYHAIQRELIPKIEMFVSYWRIIERASKGRTEIKQNGEVLIRSIGDGGISEDWLDEMRKLGSDLGPSKRHELIDVLLGMQRVREQLKAITDREDPKSAHFYLLNLRTMLSHVERYLQSFDPEMARRFDGFTKSNIDHRMLAEHVEPLIKIFEETGNLDG